MKTWITIVFISLLASITLSAQSRGVTRKMKSAGEKYVKMYLKEFPESAKGLSSTKARKKHYELLEASKILTVDEATQELLKRRKEVVTDPQMQNLIKNLAEDESKETKFLLKLATNEKLKGEGRLLVFRLLGRADKQYKEKLKEEAAAKAEENKKLLGEVFEHFKSKLEELGRMPADLEELALPENLATGLGKDWVYIGTRMKIAAGNSRLLFFNTVAQPSGATQAMNAKGQLLNIKHEVIMENWDKVKDKPAPKPKAKKKKEATPSKDSEEKPAAEAVGDEAYNKKMLQDFTAVFKKVVTKHNKTKIWPASLEGAGVSGDLLTLTSPDGTEKKPWIYVASKAKIAVSKTQFIILVSPYPRGETYLVALSDGKIVNLAASEFKKIEKAISGK